MYLTISKVKDSCSFCLLENFIVEASAQRPNCTACVPYVLQKVRENLKNIL